MLEGEIDLLERPPSQAAALFADSLAVNLTTQFSLVNCCRESLDRGSGNRSVTLCSSINALGDQGAPAYSAAKAGLIGMMHACAARLGQAGVRINVVAPGTIRTPATEREAARAGRPDRFRRAAEDTHLRRVGEPEDVASAILALADRMPHVSDQVLAVDGGQLRHRGSG